MIVRESAYIFGTSYVLDCRFETAGERPRIEVLSPDTTYTLSSPRSPTSRSSVGSQRRWHDLQESASALVPAVPGEAAPGKIQQKAQPAAVTCLK